jgi:hypothetical protein
MHLKRNDGWATSFVAAAVTFWAVWASGAAFATVSARVVGAGVLALGYTACLADGSQMRAVYGGRRERSAPIAYVVAASILGAGALVAGVIAVIGGSETMLVGLVAAIVALWTMSTVRHAMAGDGVRSGRVGARPSERPA